VVEYTRLVRLSLGMQPVSCSCSDRGGFNLHETCLQGWKRLVKPKCLVGLCPTKNKNWKLLSGKRMDGFVESLQSNFILTMSHWSSGLPVYFPSQETQVQNPWGDLCETGILLLALSCYIGDPDVIDNFCGLV
jgi:hypothetical protein